MTHEIIKMEAAKDCVYNFFYGFYLLGYVWRASLTPIVHLQGHLYSMRAHPRVSGVHLVPDEGKECRDAGAGSLEDESLQRPRVFHLLTEVLV